MWDKNSSGDGPQYFREGDIPKDFRVGALLQDSRGGRPPKILGGGRSPRDSRGRPPPSALDSMLDIFQLTNIYHKINKFTGIYIFLILF